MTAFSEAIDLLFDSALALDAVYIPKSSGPSVPVRAMMSSDFSDTSFSESNYRSSSTIIEIKAADVAKPKNGDRICVGPVTYTVQAAPEPRANRMIWVLNVNDGDKA